jgi:hypothetical protein
MWINKFSQELESGEKDRMCTGRWRETTREKEGERERGQVYGFGKLIRMAIEMAMRRDNE